MTKLIKFLSVFMMANLFFYNDVLSNYFVETFSDLNFVGIESCHLSFLVAVGNCNAFVLPELWSFFLSLSFWDLY